MTEETQVTETLMFKGKPLVLKYTLFSLIQLKEVQGVDLADMDTDEGVDFADLVKFVWAGLLYEYPEITFNDVAQAFEISEIEGLSAEMEKALSSSKAVGKPAQSLGLI